MQEHKYPGFLLNKQNQISILLSVIEPTEDRSFAYRNWLSFDLLCKTIYVYYLRG